MASTSASGSTARGSDSAVGNRDGLDTCLARICECLGFSTLFFLSLMRLVNGESPVGAVDDLS